MQHDAHEFFNHLLNSIHIYLLEEKRADLEKRRLDLQSGSSSGIKKERSSIFGRGRKAKKLHYHLQAMRGNGLDASFALTEPLAPQPDLDCSIESRAFTDDAAVLNSRANHREDKSTLMNGKTFAGSTSNINHTSPTKSASLSILNRIRSKKVSNTKLSEESDTSFPNTPKKQVTDGEEDGRTWIYDIFQGTYTTITRCLNCETVSIFLLLSLVLSRKQYELPFLQFLLLTELFDITFFNDKIFVAITIYITTLLLKIGYYSGNALINALAGLGFHAATSPKYVKLIISI